MPGGAMISMCACMPATSISISLSSSSPSRSFLRNFWRVGFSLSSERSSTAPLNSRAGGSSTSRMRSSATSSA
ncbi:hypothetical protein D3C83_101400 [compost metagenome]